MRVRERPALMMTEQARDREMDQQPEGDAKDERELDAVEADGASVDHGVEREGVARREATSVPA